MRKNHVNELSSTTGGDQAVSKKACQICRKLEGGNGKGIIQKSRRKNEKKKPKPESGFLKRTRLAPLAKKTGQEETPTVP